ncbi:hypothetical protein [Streptomyces sp. NPDC093060]|uniref:hypothetical protein n=1 Tax=Streptomyces sp. NPDC093060 TaxID=3366019 RepID=UPI00380575E8
MFQEAVPHPLAHPGGSVEVAVVDERGPGPVRLGEQVHQAVDVLVREVDDRQEDGAARQVGQHAVGVEVGREVAHALGDVQAVVQDPHLGLPSPLDQRAGLEGGVRGRRQLAQIVGATVVDHEEVGALRVVGAACRPAEHVEVRLGHDGLAVARILERPVRHGEPGAAGEGDQHRLLQLAER